LNVGHATSRPPCLSSGSCTRSCHGRLLVCPHFPFRCINSTAARCLRSCGLSLVCCSPSFCPLPSCAFSCTRPSCLVLSHYESPHRALLTLSHAMILCLLLGYLKRAYHAGRFQHRPRSSRRRRRRPRLRCVSGCVKTLVHLRRPLRPPVATAPRPIYVALI